MSADPQNDPRPGDTEEALLRKILMRLVLVGASGGVSKPYVDAGDAATLATAEAYANTGDATKVSKAGDTMSGNLLFSSASARVERSDSAGQLSLLGSNSKSTSAGINLHGETEGAGLDGWIETATKLSGSFTWSNFPTAGSLAGGTTRMTLSNIGLLSFGGTTTPGIRLSNLTTVQRDALTGTSGNLIWNTTTGRTNFYDGAAWQGGWVRLSGDSMTGVLDLGSNKITSVTDPTLAQDAATKNYVDTQHGLLTVYATGTAYTLTNSLAGVTFGTTSPILTITQAGTYMLTSRIKATFANATYGTNETLTVKLQRTNNTPAAIANTSQTFIMPIVTGVTQGIVVMNLALVTYVTVNANDILQIFASVSATPSSGSVVIETADIQALRLHA